MVFTAPEPGRLLKGQYRIDGELGRGAMGLVFRGTHVALSKPVAIKMLRPEGFNSRDALERFQREARMACQINHHCVAQVFDYGVEDGVPFLVMELVEGKDLAQVLEEEGPMAPLPVVVLMRQLAAVLAEAHKRGVVHRDIKPTNLKLPGYSKNGPLFLKVMDFGIAKNLEGPSEHKLTATGAVIGTPMYMSPEQAGSGEQVDGRADLYATGVVLYEMLTGTLPFEAPSLAGVLVGHLVTPPPELPRSVPECLRKVVARLLKKLPGERFQTADELEVALRECEDQVRGIPALPRGAVQPRQVKGATAALGLSPRGLVALASGALLIAVAVVVLVVVTKPAVRPEGPAPAAVNDLAAPAEPRVDAAAPVASPVQRGVPKRHGGTEGSAPVARSGPEHQAALDKVKEAEAKLAEGQYQEAVDLARKSQTSAETAESWRVIVLGECMQLHFERAKLAIRKVPAGQRKKLIERCREKGIDLD